MSSLLLTMLLACGAPAPEPAPPPPPAAPAAPDLDTLAAWLTKTGHTPERFDDVLRIAHDGPEGRYAVTVQAFDEAHLVFLATSSLITLNDADGERGIVLLLTNLATLNYELDEGKLQLNPASGEVMLSIELETDDGLGERTFTNALATLTATADASIPKLKAAAAAPRR